MHYVIICRCRRILTKLVQIPRLLMPYIYTKRAWKVLLFMGLRPLEEEGGLKWFETVCACMCAGVHARVHTHTHPHTQTHTHTHTLPSVLVMVREEAQKDESCADMGGVV